LAIPHGSSTRDRKVEDDAGGRSKQENGEPGKLPEAKDNQSSGATEETAEREPGEGNDASHVQKLGWRRVGKNITEIEEKIKSLQQKPPPQAIKTEENDHHDQAAAKNTIGLAMDATQNQQQWLMEFLKPNEDYMAIQNHQWLMELLKSNDQNVGFGRNEDVLQPYAFNSNSSLWY